MAKAAPDQGKSVAHQISAHAMHAKYDDLEITANARAASPGSDAYWERQIREANPDLPDDEVARRAGHLKRAHYLRLQLASAKARRAKAKARAQKAAE
jgi:hypothetical protein